jgi:hypothetical protein
MLMGFNIFSMFFISVKLVGIVAPSLQINDNIVLFNVVHRSNLSGVGLNGLDQEVILMLYSLLPNYQKLWQHLIQEQQYLLLRQLVV